MGKIFLGPQKEEIAPYFPSTVGPSNVPSYTPEIVEKTIYVEKPIFVDRIVYVDRDVEKVVEKPIEREVIKFVDREKPVYIDREVIQEKVVEKPVYIEKEIVINKVQEIEKKFIPMWMKAAFLVQTLIVIALLIK